MLNRRSLLAILAATVAFVPVQPSYAANTLSPEVAQQLGEAKARLKLTPEQEAQLRPLIEERNQKVKAIRAKHAGDTSQSAKRAMFKEAIQRKREQHRAGSGSE